MAELITFNCDQCGHAQTVALDLVDTGVRCEHCGAITQVPRPSTEVVEVTAVPVEDGEGFRGARRGPNVRYMSFDIPSQGCPVGCFLLAFVAIATCAGFISWLT